MLNKNFEKLASESKIEKTLEALVGNGMETIIAENKEEAKKMIFNMIPLGVEIMNMTSVTLSELGIDKEINESERFASVRKKMATTVNHKGIEKRRLGAAHEWVIGSAHAVTEEGQIMVASATGSQIPSYVYGALNVMFIIGTQKIVKNLDDGFKRIYKYALPLENERALKVYGVPSGVNKILIINKEVAPGRITVLLVKQKLGF